MILEELVVALGFDLKGEAELKRFEAGLTRVRSTLGTFGKVAAVGGVAIAGLGAVAATAGLALASHFGPGLAKSVIETSAEFEVLGIQLKSLEGSAEAGQKALDWIRDFAVETPLTLQETIKAYVGLKNFGLDPTNGTLLALVDTMAASGKGAEQLNGIVLALGQAWTKEKLQAEEANQLLERGVPVWELLEKVTGKNAAALQDLASKGKIGRREIGLLIQEMGRRASGASAEFSRSWRGMTGRLSEEWEGFKERIGKAGFFKFVENELAGLLRVIARFRKDGTLDTWATGISKSMTSFLTTVGELAIGIKARIEGLPQSFKDVATSANEAFANTRRELAALDAFFSGELNFGANTAREFEAINTAVTSLATAVSGLNWGEIGTDAQREAELVRRTFNELVAWFGTLDLAAAGAQMMASLTRGIASGGAQAVSAAKAIGEQIRGALSSISPSFSISGPSMGLSTTPQPGPGAKTGGSVGEEIGKQSAPQKPADNPLLPKFSDPPGKAANPPTKQEGASLRTPARALTPPSALPAPRAFDLARLRTPVSDGVRGLKPTTQVASNTTTVGDINVTIQGSAKEADVRRGVASGLKDAGVGNPTRNLFFNTDSPVTA